MENQNEIDDKQYKRSIKAWTMYDWANSAFATTIMGVVLPLYFGTYISEGDTVPI